MSKVKGQNKEAHSKRAESKMLEGREARKLEGEDRQRQGQSRKHERIKPRNKNINGIL